MRFGRSPWRLFVARVLTVVVALAVVGAGITAASPAPTAPGQVKRGGTMVVGADVNPVGLDPNKSTALSTWVITEQIYDSLLRRGFDNAIEPSLAVSWETPNDRTFIFKLRQNAKFSNGRAFTADDVKYSFGRLTDPATASPWRKIFGIVQSVDVLDTYTVQFSLEKPFAPLLSYLSLSHYFPIIGKEVVEEGGGDLQSRALGTGPFMLAEYKPDDHILLRRNPHYWEEGLPYLDAIDFKIIPDQVARLAAVRSGTVDYTWMFEPRIEDMTRADRGLSVNIPSKAVGEEGLAMNQTKPPFNNVDVRRAVSLAVDRPALIQAVLNGKGQIGTKIPPGSAPYGYVGDGSDLPYHTRDVQKAKDLLAGAGYANGIDTTLVVSPQYPRDVRTAEVMKEQLAEANIRVEILQQEWGKVIKEFVNTEYDGMSMIGMIWQPDPDADVYDIYHSESSINLGKWSDPEVDRLLEEGRTTLDVEKRVQIYRELQHLVADRAYLIFPYTVFGGAQIWRDHVKGYVMVDTPFHPAYRQTWLDK